MELLPNEVLLMIFERVPPRDLLANAGRVCRRWEQLVNRLALAIRKPGDIGKLHHGIVTIELTTRVESLNVFLNTVSETCPLLRNLTVHSMNTFSHLNLGSINRMPFLDHLDIFVQSRVVDEHFLPVLMRLSSVVINDTVRPGVLIELIRNKRLRALYMYGNALCYPHRELAYLVSAHCNQLQELTLRCTELPDEAYSIISQCKFLTSLQLYSCRMMRSTGVMCITRLRRLKRLHITGAQMVRCRAMRTFVINLPLFLEELVLSATKFSDAHVPLLIARLPWLQTLEIWRCALKRNGLMSLVRGLDVLKTLDTDVHLSEGHIDIIAQHKCLRILRCYMDKSFKQNLLTKVKNNGETLKVLSARAKFSQKFIHNGQEGFRAGLNYFSTRDLNILPRNYFYDEEVF